VNEDKSINTETPEYNSNPFTLSFKGFGLLAEYAKSILIIMIVIGSLGLLLNIFSYIPDSSNNSSVAPLSQNNTEGNNSEAISVTTIAMIILGVSGIILLAFAISLLISALYKGFVAAGTVSAMEKKTITAGEAFSKATGKLDVLFKAEIIASLKIIGGYILLIVPGVRAQLRYQSTPYIIMSNDEITASDAIKTSKELYRKHLLEAFGIATVGSIIPFIGQAVMASGMTLSVNQLTAYKALNKETPKTHWLNYIGLLFFAFIILIILSMTLIVIAFVASSSN
jgi:hypothetical protein